MRRLLALISLVVVVVAACGSGGDETGATTPPGVGGSRGVTQGGPQDIALFRQIVSEGGVPAPETLDPVGFFAEHALDLPAADCGEDVCVHPLLAVAPRFDGSNWTMAYVGLNSAVDPATLARPPLHLVVALERTSRTQDIYSAAELGLRVMASRMRAEDRLSILVFGHSAVPLLTLSLPDPAAIDAALLAGRDVAFADASALYDAIATAGQLARDSVFDGESRILLLTSGHADTGITDVERVVGLAAAWARESIAINVIGGGSEYDPEIPSRIGDLGVGTYTYAESAVDLDRILRFEGDTTMFPLATDFRLNIQAATGYRVGRIYGARRASATNRGATLESPALFLGHRTGSTDVGGGRRGGGGGLFVELIAEEGALSLGAGQPAFTMSATWLSGTGAPVRHDQAQINSLPPGQNPASMWAEVSDPAHQQGFMMLNMYLALRAAVEFHQAGDCARALGVIDMVAPTVERWLAEWDNPDIIADFELLMRLRANIEAACQTQPVQPQFFSGSCMYS